MDYKQAKELLNVGDYSPGTWFKANGHVLEYAYCLFLSGELDKALEQLEQIRHYNTRADWACKIINFIKSGQLEQYPTFLQTRNFLEIDLTLLIMSMNLEYANKLINMAPLFYNVCKESYKFIGRALYYCKHKELAYVYYKLAKDNFYNDGELHYLLGVYYYNESKKEQCKKSMKTCLRLVPEYKPAKKILEKMAFDN